MPFSFTRFARIELAPPRYLALPTAGIDISTSGVKLAVIKEQNHGLELVAYGEKRLELGAIVSGEITDHVAVVKAVSLLANEHSVSFANIALPESRGYLFEADVPGHSRMEWRTSVERHIDEYVPLPPSEVLFDIVPIATQGDTTRVVGVGYARRVVDESLKVLDDADIMARSIESENFALPRALLHRGATDTVLIIDIGKTTTKLLVVAMRIPRFATTLDIGGHALTLAVQKHFSVTEEEAKRVKAEKGIVPGAGNEEYLATMLSTVSVIREEIARRLEYWQSRASGEAHEPVSRAILVGGNATVRGLPEYLATSFKIPVELGNVFVNFASPNDWLPPMDYMESLAYGTAFGLALRDYDF